MTVAALVIAAYLIGSVPFGYLVGRAKGVDLFKAGSGNIGATNVGRVLGRGYGVLVFVLDFLKGAVPVALVVPVGHVMERVQGLPAGSALSADELRVGAAVAAFLGHLFPIYLGFRGGKGVATGAGVVSVLMPVPTAIAAGTWLLTALLTRFVSLASVLAVAALVAARLALTPHPFDPYNLAVTAFCLAGTALVVVKHRANIRRLLAGTENRIGDGAMRQTVLKGLHLLAVGLWFGGAGFFNFGTAVPIFESFKKVVNDGPSARTAGQPIIKPDAGDEEKKALANALAGAAVGPVFPNYFAMQAGCAVVALGTALAWWSLGRVHRWRVVLLGVAAVTVAVGWPVSNYVSEVRPLRFSPDPAVAKAAVDAFGTWHFVSLGLSCVTVLLAGVGLALGAKLPAEPTRA